MVEFKIDWSGVSGYKVYINGTLTYEPSLAAVNSLVKEVLEDEFTKAHTINRALPKIAKMIAGVLDLKGPFTKHELDAAYSSVISPDTFKQMIGSVLTYVGKKDREYLYELSNAGIAKLSKYMSYSNFDTEKKAAEDRVNNYRNNKVK